jgi:hypothetical protein
LSTDEEREAPRKLPSDAMIRPVPQSPGTTREAFTILTTVGFGDVYPTTSGGRLVSVALVLTGMGLFSLLTAEIATHSC